MRNFVPYGFLEGKVPSVIYQGRRQQNKICYGAQRQWENTLFAGDDIHSGKRKLYDGGLFGERCLDA